MPIAVKSFFTFTLTFLLASGAAFAMTDEENAKLKNEMKDYQFKNVTTKEGFNFKIPGDMPIETRNGVTAPIPFEEYLYFKLKKLDERLSAIEKKIDDLGNVFAATRKEQAEKAATTQEKAGLLSSS